MKYTASEVTLDVLMEIPVIINYLQPKLMLYFDSREQNLA